MSAGPEEFKPFETPAFELRVTGCALADLGCSKLTARGDLDAVETTSTYKNFVGLFRLKYRDSPRGTGVPIHGVSRNDVISLHGPEGGRAATWYDEENAVCWLLGFTPEHDYTLFEQRAATGELLPSEDDYAVLLLERDTIDFDQMFKRPVTEMLKEAMSAPGASVKRTVADMLQIAVVVQLEEVADEDVVHIVFDVFLSVRIPPLVTWRPPGWPGARVARRLIELATGRNEDGLSTLDPEEFPDDSGGMRRVDWASEIAVQACSLDGLAEGPPRHLDDDGRGTRPP